MALIGADGAGKTTVSGRLRDTLPVPVKSIYMGVNLEASARMLPTTRLLLFLRTGVRKLRPTGADASTAPGSSDLASASAKATPAAQRVRRVARLGVWTSEEIFRQVLAWYYSRFRGNIVVFDRHFFLDYYAHDVAESITPRPMTRRIHGFLLQHVYAKPDLVIFLDAPPELLYARKPETPLNWLRRKREQYLSLRNVVPNFVEIDASRPLDEVARDVADVIARFGEERKSSGPTPRARVA